MTRISKDLLIRRTIIITGIGILSAIGGWFLSQIFVEFMMEGLALYGPMEEWTASTLDEGTFWLMSTAVAGLVSIFAYMSVAILWIGWWSAGKLEEMKRGNEGIHNDSPK